jgi:predicted nucleotidyltransferase
MAILPHDFKDFLRLLNEKSVEYLLVGGYAVGYHGYPRATADLDVWIARNPENAQRVTEALRDFGFDLPDLKPDLFFDENRIVRLGLPPLRIEVITSASGVTFEECYLERIRAEIDGISVNIIGREQLLANKRAAGRHKDLDDIEHLIY